VIPAPIETLGPGTPTPEPRMQPALGVALAGLALFGLRKRGSPLSERPADKRTVRHTFTGERAIQLHVACSESRGECGPRLSRIRADRDEGGGRLGARFRRRDVPQSKDHRNHVRHSAKKFAGPGILGNGSPKTGDAEPTANRGRCQPEGSEFEFTAENGTNCRNTLV